MRRALLAAALAAGLAAPSAASAIPFPWAGADGGHLAAAEWTSETETSFEDLFAVGVTSPGGFAPLADDPSLTRGVIDAFRIGCENGELVLRDYWTEHIAYQGTPLMNGTITQDGPYDGQEIRFSSCDEEVSFDDIVSWDDLTDVPMSVSVTATQNGDIAPETQTQTDSQGDCAYAFGELDLVRPAAATFQASGIPGFDTSVLAPWAAVVVAGGAVEAGVDGYPCLPARRADLHGDNGRLAQRRAIEAALRSFASRR